MFPEVRMDAAGHAIAVWQQINPLNPSGLQSIIWANRFVPETGWGTARLLNTEDRTNTPFFPAPPQVAVGPNGDAVAVWQKLDGTRDDVWANRFVPDTGWGPATLLETDDSGNARDPDVAVDATGHAMAVWSQSDGTRSHIWASRFSPGTSWDTPTRLEADDSADHYAPLIAMNPTGDAIAVWQQFDGTRLNLLTNRFVTGTGWGTPTLLETDDSGDIRPPDLSMNSHGDAMVVWPQSDGTRWNLWARRFVSETGWDTATILTPDQAGDVWSPRVATDASGDAIVVWAETDGTRWTSWAKRFVPATGWAAGTLLNTVNSETAWFPDVAINARGDAMVTWAQSNGTHSNIWARCFARETGWKTATPIDTNESGDARNPQVELDTTGNAIVVWERFDGTTTNLWANRFVP